MPAPVRSAAAMRAPPAPAPSFANPLEYAASGSADDEARPGSTASTGTDPEDASATDRARVAVRSAATYEVVPTAVLDGSYPDARARASTAAICVPPARITARDSLAAPSMPATVGSIGSPSSAAAANASARRPGRPARRMASDTTLSLRATGLSGMLELVEADPMPRPLIRASAVVVPPGTVSPMTMQSARAASVRPTMRP